MIFAREVSDPLTSLVKKIDAATVKNSANRMCSFVVFLTDEENAKDKLKTLADKEGIKKTILTIDNVPGPPDYHIAKEADVTVVLYNKRKVEVNYAFKKGELNSQKIDQIIGDLPKILPNKTETR
jgi:hypothetical protein